ncbi:MAG: Lon protease family protein [Alphaproteobacteria bacterium]
MTEPLDAARLCWHCDAGAFDFETTDDLEDHTDVLGQKRAVEAIRFGIDMDYPGYNIFAFGPEGIGKHTVVNRALEGRAAGEPVPDDWCYVSNFEDPHRPRAISLPAGRGAELRADMARFVDDCRAALHTAFESEEYRTRRQVFEEELKERNEEAMADIEREARESDIALLRTPVGFAFAPIRDGEVTSPDVFKKMPADERKKIEQDINELQDRLKIVLQHAPVWLKETRDHVRQLNEETARFAVGHLIDSLCERYTELPQVVSYLKQVGGDVVDNVGAFLAGPEKARPEEGVEPEDGPALFRKYRVNLIVDNGGRDSASVIYEDNPIYDRLIGRIEQRAQMGALLTDFNLIRPGALHRANGGYLLLDARKLLLSPMAWEGLKQALKSGEIRIEPPARALGLLSTLTLDPEPIPLKVKVALVGERFLYYLLQQHDPEFDELFKVGADFDEQIDRSSDTVQLYARLVATVARKEKLLAFDRGAVAAALEAASRRASDSMKISTHVEGLTDLLREANHHAATAGRKAVAAEDVRAAVEAQIYRSDRIRERVQEEIKRGTFLIDTAGASVGQVNGLSVIAIAGFAFGRPNRITARVRVGRGEVIDIEREVALGGPLHSKGVLILSGYLSARYATDKPLSLTASLVFEQSYSGVEGDSASSAELYALLSAIAEAPLKQSLAVTGSVNQTGQVQAIGGVNEKIEGFFDVCAGRGLTGEQGVLIPKSNVEHLMLHERVVKAAKAGKFHIYSVETIDEGIEILSGMRAGKAKANGTFPTGTFNHKVERRLAEFAEARRAFGAAAAHGSND